MNGAAGTAIDDFKSNVIGCSRKISLTKNIASSEHNKQSGILKIPNNGEILRLTDVGNPSVHFFVYGLG